VGCGTGVLSVLAVKAGAIKVYAVDNADIEEMMSSEFRQLIKEGKIEFIKATIEELASEEQFRIPKVDVVVSEWMGYFLIFENMISSYMFAIKTFLKPEGVVVPSHATMYLDVAFYDFVDNPKLTKKHFNPNNPCKVVLIEQCKADHLLSNDPTSIKVFDFTDRTLQNPLDSEGFACNFKIQVAKAGTFNAFVGSFDTKLCDGVVLNTMPLCPVTHWK
jgi:cyclopropane fatty-acyl-phospholipid synthase-like methyltransferase